MSIPYVAPRERILGTHYKFVKDNEGNTYRGHKKVDRCYDQLLSETIGRLIRYDPRAWEHICKTQYEWRRIPPDSGSAEFIVTDITDGQMFREHPELGAAMAGSLPEPDEPMRLAIELYYDGVETANPIGVARGRKKAFLFPLLACF
eukprot:822179-Pleurochrysis_carterae.AAC.1